MLTERVIEGQFTSCVVLDPAGVSTARPVSLQLVEDVCAATRHIPMASNVEIILFVALETTAQGLERVVGKKKPLGSSRTLLDAARNVKSLNTCNSPAWATDALREREKIEALIDFGPRTSSSAARRWAKHHVTGHSLRPCRFFPSLSVHRVRAPRPTSAHPKTTDFDFALPARCARRSRHRPDPREYRDRYSGAVRRGGGTA